MPSDAKETMIYPGDDPLMKPDGDYVWQGSGDVASRQGMWTHIVTKEGWREDLNHALPIGAHWDYYDENKKRFRVYPDNSFEFVKGRKK